MNEYNNIIEELAYMDEKLDAIMDEIKAISATFKTPSECEGAVKNLSAVFPEPEYFTFDENGNKVPWKEDK